MNFVTGATGLLGSHLVFALLKKGERVRALRRSAADTSALQALLVHMAPQERLFERIEWCDGDVLDVPSLLDGMSGCTHVYHCAAVVSYHRRDRKQMYATNVEGTANMVNAAMECGIQKFCFVSSIAAIGRTELQTTLDETSEWTDSDLNTHYGITKFLSEMEVWRGEQEGLDVVIVNPGFIIGPGRFDRSSAAIFTKINEGMPVYPPGGTGFVAVSDVVRAMVQLMHSTVKSERFILVAENGSMQSLFERIARGLGKRVPTRVATPWMLQLARLADALRELFTGQRALVTRETVRNASNRWHYKADKIKTALSEFEYTSVDAAVEATCTYFKL